ncbi:hypothetical protein [Duganella callida]|uniref:Uncharacterized protein n=1 Tax=Duganella callida TaxID=2561932 RepID=A0A4Y9SUP5_9BURK|nr:hypothetical protein [Duganella callida]TFW30158.1 hypothetical protein E4L98_02560 [Duganella callida]
MADTNDSIQQVIASYQTVHKAIIAALGATTDSAAIARLLAEDKAAYAAFQKANNGKFNSHSSEIAAMIGNLKAATAEIDKTEAEIAKIVNITDKIDRAVGVLAKIAALVG